jgi:hypothetical protein
MREWFTHACNSGQPGHWFGPVTQPFFFFFTMQHKLKKINKKNKKIEKQKNKKGRKIKKNMCMHKK